MSFPNSKQTEPAATGASEELGLGASVAARLDAQSSNVRMLRRAQRVDVSLPARIATGGLVLPVIISDVSLTGMGFRGQTGVLDWTEVEVLLPDGRVLAGTVIWTHNGRGGIELAAPLSIDDPLFGGVEAVAAEEVQHVLTKGSVRPGFMRRLWNMLVKDREGDKVDVEEFSTPPSRSRPPFSQRTLRRACHKQGNSWLVDEEELPRPHE